MFVPKLLASAVSSTAALTWSITHTLVAGAVGAQDVVLGVGAGGSLLYLAYKVFQDETVARRERRLYEERLEFERREAWEKGRRGEPLDEEHA